MRKVLLKTKLKKLQSNLKKIQNNQDPQRPLIKPITVNKILRKLQLRILVHKEELIQKNNILKLKKLENLKVLQMNHIHWIEKVVQVLVPSIKNQRDKVEVDTMLEQYKMKWKKVKMEIQQTMLKEMKKKVKKLIQELH